MRRIALYAGSFDPFHEGHLHLLKKALSLFDEVIVCVAINVGKSPKASMRARKAAIERAIAKHGLKNARAATCSGYVALAARRRGAGYLVAGARNVDDLRAQLRAASFNKRLAPEVETVVLFSDAAHRSLSSSRFRRTLREHEAVLKAR